MPPMCTAIARIFRDTSGASAMIVAIALPVLIGFGALGAETGAWFTIKLRDQSAADAAAIAAAYEVIAGKTDVRADLNPATSEAAMDNGYNGSTPSAIYPYSDAIVGNGVKVKLQQTLGAVLASMFLTEVSVTTKAVAVIETLDNPCILALGGSGTDLEIQPGVHLDIPSCSAVTNSIGGNSIALQDTTSSVTAATLVTAGEVSLQGNPIDPAAAPPEFVLASPAMIGAPSVADPYAGTLTHRVLTDGMPTAGGCTSHSTAGVTTYSGNCVVAGASLTEASIKLTGGTQVAGAWTILSGHTVDLAPGTYWVTGNFTIQSGAVLKCSTCDNVGGTGVTIILIMHTNKIGALSIASKTILNLNAPHSGRFAGLVIVQDSNGLPPGTTYTSRNSKIGGGPGATLNGLIYFPNSSLTFHGNPSATGPRCLVLVANSVDVNATSGMDTGGCASAGLTSLPVVSTVALAE
jgi:Flp pilus assembly protein TadG